MRSVFYSILTFGASCLLAARLLCSSRGRARILERFGLWGALDGEYLWFHGASLGEIEGLMPIIEKSRGPRRKILCSATSITGLERAQTVADEIRMLPFDSFPFLVQALSNVSIGALVISESEIWPGLFEYLARRNIPIVIVNGRLSERSAKRIQRYSCFLGAWPSTITRCFAVDHSTAERYQSIGLDPLRIEVIGNTKYDRDPKVIHPKEERSKYFGSSPKVIVIGSIRPDEEKIIFPAIRDSLAKGMPCVFVIAPRHKEKFGFFEQSLKEYNLPFVKWSEAELPITGDTVLLLDVIGILETFYACADGVCIGGSLVDYGGHNPLEPAPYRVAVAIGPFTSSTGTLVDEVVTRGAMIRVSSTEDIIKFFSDVSHESEKISMMKDALYTFWSDNRGASHKVVAALNQLIGE